MRAAERRERRQPEPWLGFTCGPPPHVSKSLRPAREAEVIKSYRMSPSLHTRAIRPAPYRAIVPEPDPSRESPLAGAPLADYFVDHCERRDRERSAEAEARGHGGWRAGGAAGAISRLQARGGAGRSGLQGKTAGLRGALPVSQSRAAQASAPLSAASAHGRGRARALHSFVLVMQRE